MAFGFDTAELNGMDAILAAAPAPPRSPLGSSLLRGAGVSSPRSPLRDLNPPPAPSVAKPPPPREAARREFSPTAADVADADAALKKMEAELAATLAAPPAPPAPAPSPQRGKPRLSYASTRDAVRRARNGQRPALRLRPVATHRPSLGDPASGPVRKKRKGAPVEVPPRKKRKARKKAASDDNRIYGIDKTGRSNANVCQAWGKSGKAAEYVECELGKPYKPGPAVLGAEELVAEAVPQACLGYPDYQKGRGNKMFKKGTTASAFYKANGYWKIKVYKAGGYWTDGRMNAVYKFFKEVKRA